jgi:hypothetical protein
VAENTHANKQNNTDEVYKNSGKSIEDVFHLDVPTLSEVKLKEKKADEVLELLKQITTVKKIPPKILGDSYIYHIHINNRVIIIESKDLLKHNTFSKRYFECFNRLPTSELRNAEIWTLFVNSWDEKGLLKEEIDETPDDESYAAELFLEEISDLQVTTDTEELIYNPQTLLEKEDGLCIPSRQVHEILDRLRLNIKINRLVPLLGDTLIDTRRAIKVKGKTMRFWVFKKELKQRETKTEEGG